MSPEPKVSETVEQSNRHVRIAEDGKRNLATREADCAPFPRLADR